MFRCCVRSSERLLCFEICKTASCTTFLLDCVQSAASLCGYTAVCRTVFFYRPHEVSPTVNRVIAFNRAVLRLFTDAVLTLSAYVASN